VLDRLRSAYYGFWLGWQERSARVRGPRPETPAYSLPALDAPAALRIDQLRQRYGVAFEQQCGVRSALANYEYLDWLDAAFDAWAIEPPRPRELHDVGCGGFAYAHALHRRFAPERLVGIDVEGRRRLRDGATRHERVLAHLAALPGAEFVVADYTRWSRPADLVTAFFPFVTPAPLLAWRLPLRLLAPAELFAAIARNLVPEGHVLMANHSSAEYAIAAGYARGAGLVERRRFERARLVSIGAPDVVLTWWSGADVAR
jgi:SAM-dependent methyltransferase